ncbi:MAG: aminotransferase class I/II-fold pyridoxal phosphate-dependent enzyme [Eubacteriales bacterium]|jgi:aminotransferase|nr:aminotransferase class I/II-fold pyridoxal phosphate-dependent enzyme [Eubacteriales bacterium]
MSFDVSSKLSPVVTSIQPSGIRKFFDIVSSMPDAISLGVGEPDFVTPWHIRDAGIYSLEKGKTYYTSNSGIIELRMEICNYTERRFGLSYDPDTEVLVTVGGSEAIDLCIRALVSKGDEVLIPEPSFVCYSPCTSLAGGVPVPIVTKEEEDFKLTPEALRAAITPRTKLLILPYPNNPTGAVLTREDLQKIADVIKETDIMILSDEIYAELTYETKHVSIASIDGMQERTILVNGFSKAYAMTGWRLGYACGHPDIIAAMTKIHQYAIMSTPTTSQFAAVEALRNGDDDVAEMVAEYNYRRKVILEGVRQIGLSCFEPFGAFYVFPNITITGMNSNEFCERLLKEEKVAVVPGNAFGKSGEGFIRCSYAYSIADINRALERIDKFVAKYK